MAAVQVRPAIARGSRESLPSCPDGTPPKRYYADPIEEVTCEPCACSWPDATCTAPKLDCHDNSTSCGGSVDYTLTADSTDCVGVSGLESCKLAGGPTITGADACDAQGGAVIDTLVWGTEVFVCDATEGAFGCQEGEACLPINEGEYGKICVHKDGATDCPEGWTEGPSLQVYTGADDHRDCSICDCATAASCDTDGGYIVYDGDACDDSSKDVFNNACVNVILQTGNSGSIMPLLATVLPGECGGGQPTGSLTLKGDKKICCLP